MLGRRRETLELFIDFKLILIAFVDITMV